MERRRGRGGEGEGEREGKGREGEGEGEGEEGRERETGEGECEGWRGGIKKERREKKRKVVRAMFKCVSFAIVLFRTISLMSWQ